MRGKTDHSRPRKCVDLYKTIGAIRGESQLMQERDPPKRIRKACSGEASVLSSYSVRSVGRRVRFTFPVGVSPETVRGDGGRVNR